MFNYLTTVILLCLIVYTVGFNRFKINWKNKAFLMVISSFLLYSFLSGVGDQNNYFLHSFRIVVLINLANIFLVLIYALLDQKIDQFFWSNVAFVNISLIFRFIYGVEYSAENYWQSLDNKFVAVLFVVCFLVPVFSCCYKLINGRKKVQKHLTYLKNLVILVVFLAIAVEYFLPNYLNFKTNSTLTNLIFLIFTLGISVILSKDNFLFTDTESLVLDNIPEIVIWHDSFGYIKNVNQTAANYLHKYGITSLKRHTLTSLFLQITDEQTVCNILGDIDINNDFAYEEANLEVEVVDRYHQSQIYRVIKKVLQDNTTRTKVGGVIILTNITDTIAMQKSLCYRSYHDELTGLYNRYYFNLELKRLNCLRNLPLSIAIIDVDDLKVINDCYGHRKGDQLICDVANSLKKVCRDDEIICRFGGDEFEILFPKTTHQQAHLILKRISDEISKHYIEGQQESISYGIGTKVVMDEKIEDIFQRADEQMYHNKKLAKETNNLRTKPIIDDGR